MWGPNSFLVRTQYSCLGSKIRARFVWSNSNKLQYKAYKKASTNYKFMYNFRWKLFSIQSSNYKQSLQIVWIPKYIPSIFFMQSLKKKYKWNFEICAGTFSMKWKFTVTSITSIFNVIFFLKLKCKKLKCRKKKLEKNTSQLLFVLFPMTSSFYCEQESIGWNISRTDVNETHVDFNERHRESLKVNYKYGV